MEVFDNKIVIAMLGAIFTLLGAILVQLLIYWMATRKERSKHLLEIMGVISAFRAEIGVYKRQLESNLKVFSKYEDRPDLISQVIAQSVFIESKVYDSHIRSIGHLGPVFSEQIVRFYATVEALTHTIEVLQNYTSKGDEATSVITDKIKRQLETSLQRAKIMEAFLSASLAKGSIYEEVQLAQIVVP